MLTLSYNKVCFSTFCSEDTSKRRASKSKSFKDVDTFEVVVLDKNCACKFKSLQILLIAIISATVVTLLTPTVYDHQLQMASR
jgi:xylan alpha-glucuronosyltransferase